jgi:hypothetical protein
MITKEHFNKAQINQIIGRCLDEIKEKTGIVLDAKVNGRTISVYIDDPDELYIKDLMAIEHAVLDVVGDSNLEMLKSKNRCRSYVDARAIFSHISKQHDFTLKSIGKYIRRDHTTIIHHIRKAESLLQTDPYFAKKYNRVMENLKKTYGKDIY